MVMEEIVAVGSAAPASASAPADRSRYGGRRCVEFSTHATTAIYLSHLFRTLSTPPAFTQSVSQPASHRVFQAHHIVHRHTATRKYPGSDPRSTPQFRVRLALVDSALGRFSFSPQCTTTTTALSTLYSTAIRSLSPSAVPRSAPLATQTTSRPVSSHLTCTLGTPGSIPDSTLRSPPGNIIELEVCNPSPLLSFGPSPLPICFVAHTQARFYKHY